MNIFTLLPLLLVVAVLVGTGQATTPQCRWACDDPVCYADCQAVCDAPVCSYVCEDSSAAAATCRAPACKIGCLSAANSSVADSCPACETQCTPLTCTPATAACQIVCEQPACHWYCTKPAKCAAPKCALTCERAACEGPAPLKSNVPATWISYSALLVLVSGGLFL